MASASPRRSRKGRYSIARLSNDTTATLPVYSQSLQARSVPNLATIEPADPPPQYQYEADADEESDGGQDTSELDVVPPLSPPSARHRTSRPSTPASRARRTVTSQHRPHSSLSLSPLSLPPTAARCRSASPSRSASPDDPYLDALLARSVQALEVSNALLQSSMSTQTSLAALIADDSPPHSAGPSRVTPAPHAERHAPMTSKKRHDWTDDMNHLENEITGLFVPSSSAEVSRSLPSAAGPSPIRQRLRSHNRIRSCSTTDLRVGGIAGAGPPSDALEPDPVGELHFGVNPRSRLISPAPRAITQYVDCDPSGSPDNGQVLLPSTLGLRAAGHAYDVQTPVTSSPTEADMLPIDGLPAPSSSRGHVATSFRPSRPTPLAPSSQPGPELKKQPELGLTPSAVSLLSSFLSRRPSTRAPNSRIAKSPAKHLPRRRASIETTSPTAARPISYHYQHEQTQLPHRAHTPSTPSSVTTVSRPSRSPTPTRRRATPPPLSLAPLRTMTPPLEVSSPSPDSDSSLSPPSSDAQPRLALTVQALRKILTDQPPPPPKGFQPRTAVVPTVGTSHATASISRLFTRGTHMHAGSEDARIARRSALKQRGNSSSPVTLQSPAPPPTPSASFLGLPLPGLRSGSAPSSGRSTPKRISFAALPEDTTGAVRGTRARSRSRSRAKRRRMMRDSPVGDEGAEGWWAAWLMGGSSGFTGIAPGEMPAANSGRDSRRASPGWGRGLHGMEDFAV